jgi:hypothetical protein
VPELKDVDVASGIDAVIKVVARSSELHSPNNSASLPARELADVRTVADES